MGERRSVCYSSWHTVSRIADISAGWLVKQITEGVSAEEGAMRGARGAWWGCDHVIHIGQSAFHPMGH